MVKGQEGKKGMPIALQETILEAAYPSVEDIDHIKEISRDLLENSRKVLDEMGLQDVEPKLVGSVAKGTMMKDADIDLFLLFPSGTDKTDLEIDGLKAGRELLTEPERRYTQHPYLTGRYEGIRCDVVPCLALEPGTSVSTAVDRTPLHTEYINKRLAEDKRKDVVLLKSFLKGIGSYGAEDTVEGFSGYLTELLVLHFGSFYEVLEALSMIDGRSPSPAGCEVIEDTKIMHGPEDVILFNREGSYLDEPKEPEVCRRDFSNHPLIVIDPVDSSRNVASPISAGTRSYTSRASRAFIRNPTESFFHPFSQRPLASKRIATLSDLDPRDTFFALDLPDGDPGAVITQLKRSLRKLGSHLERIGFDNVSIRFLAFFPEGRLPDQSYLKARYSWRSQIEHACFVVRVRTEPEELPEEYRHLGPPMNNSRIKDFRLRWGKEVRVDEELGRSYTIVKRKVTLPGPIIKELWENSVHGSLFKESKIREPMELQMISLDVFNGLFDPWNQ